MQTDLTIWKNLNNNNITFANISCYLKQFMSQSKFSEGLDKKNLTLKIHSAFVPKYHLAFKLHDTCTKLIWHSYSKQKIVMEGQTVCDKSRSVRQSAN